MQTSHAFLLDTYNIISEDDINNHIFSLIEWERIFFYGDLGAGKSTFIRHLLRSHFHDENLIVRSPTYTYYQKYGKNVYHFDLYRVESFDDLYLLWVIEILEDQNSICLIEWPEILWDFIQPTKKISLEILHDGKRKMILERGI